MAIGSILAARGRPAPPHLHSARMGAVHPCAEPSLCPRQRERARCHRVLGWRRALWRRRCRPRPRTSAAPVRHNVDGRLRLGVWLPTSGSAEMLGTPLIAGVELAVQQINDAGGVNGHRLEMVTRNEGSDPGDGVRRRCRRCSTTTRSTSSWARRRLASPSARSTCWPTRVRSPARRRPRRST